MKLSYSTAVNSVSKIRIAPCIAAGGLGFTIANCNTNFGVQDKFFRAVQRGNIGEVEYLLKTKGVDVNRKHELGWTALHLAAVNGRQEECYMLDRSTPDS